MTTRDEWEALCRRVAELRAEGLTVKEIARRIGRACGRGLLDPERFPRQIFAEDLAARPAVCQHCRNRKVERPRGLCWPCYYTPGVRDRYPPVNAFGRRGVGLGRGAGDRPPPPRPTPARPGTPEKLAVLCERARGGFTLWHPDDAMPALQPGWNSPPVDE